MTIQLRSVHGTCGPGLRQYCMCASEESHHQNKTEYIFTVGQMLLCFDTHMLYNIHLKASNHSTAVLH